MDASELVKRKINKITQRVELYKGQRTGSLEAIERHPNPIRKLYRLVLIGSLRWLIEGEVLDELGGY